jgi:GNAT superfamily N-acetyltransferase
MIELNSDSLHRIDEIGQAFAKEAEYPGGWHLPAFRRMWSVLLDHNIGQIWAIEESGKLVAVLGAVFMEDPHSGWPTATEQFWYVLPEARKTRMGMDLFRIFERQAYERKSKKMVMVHLAALTPESLQKFYEKEGFRLAEQTFWKEL